MKIYFSTSISNMTDDVRSSCRKIFEILKKEGHKILSEDILNKDRNFYACQDKNEALLVQKNLTKLKKIADIIIFEVTNQSIGVGQEISTALSMNKPVIALYDEHNNVPHILRDEGGDLLMLRSYSYRNMSEVLFECMKYASSYQDVRFDFLIPPAIGAHLDQISKKKRISRAVYIRSLIEADMNKQDAL